LYLKKIELHGFKSFANRVAINFQKGINAIVGPNGCGKSNITDAVRWVLGEQSIRSLRGYKLEDVIFAGSHSKKPMGMAEVSITLDNEDNMLPVEYSEICIVRRAFRSGESEFYLNKTPCRLKDIQELLMDTGVGKDGYSIISQGQIDEILKCRPEERRALLEEAAGIAKHKTRKRQAEKRLDETVNNITRLDDILSEIRLLLIPLAEQKDKALEYKRLLDKYKQIDVNLHLAHFDKKNKKTILLRNSIADYEKRLQEFTNESKGLRDKIAACENEMGFKEREVEKLQHQHYNSSNKFEVTKKELAWLHEEDIRLKNEMDTLEQRAKYLSEKIESDKKTLNLKTSELEHNIKEINCIEIRINELNEKISAVDREIKQEENQLEGLKGDVIDILNYISEKRNLISNLNTMKSNLHGRISQIKKENDDLEKANKKTNLEINKAKAEKQKIESECKQVDESAKHYETAIAQLQSELRFNDANYSKNQQALSALTSKLKALKEISEDFEGYSYGAKNLLLSIKNKKLNIDGIYGPIAELITVKKGYEAAIEAALGGALQNIVCDEEQSAKRAIEFLKEQKMGRVTFLPLRAVVSKSLGCNELSLLHMKGCISAADKLVTYDKMFHPIISYYLGRVLVVNSIDNAISIARKCNYSLKIVTVAGEVFSPGGAITGGSRRKTASIFERKRAISEYDSDIKKIRNDLTDIEKKREILISELKDKERSLGQIQVKISDLKIKSATLSQQIEEKRNILQERLERKEQLENERKQIDEQLKDIDSSYKALEQAQRDLDSKSVSNQNEAELLQVSISEKKSIRDKLYSDITNIKIEYSAKKQEEINLKQTIQTLESNVKELIAELEIVTEKNGQILKNKNSLSKKMAYLKEQLIIIEDEQVDIEKKINQLKNDRDLLKGQIAEQKNILEDLINRQKKVEKKLNNLKISEATYSAEITGIKNRLWEKYEITPGEARELKRDLGEIQAMEKLLVEVQDKLNSLGVVNMRAIEEHDNLKTRYDFLTKQREDLVDAKRKLDNLIEEITKTMTEMFKTCFKKVCLEFNNVFSDLFGGGKAELIVEGEGDLLESGIEIIAQPPGKKLQNISLLSGGESSLTAIALLFAILNTKPAPFCILDEIESALDESNLERFTKYLKKVSRHTQFIIITHRKNTMEASDALYGVVMEDTAVSKVLAVKMEQ
jgi:chromosome segregation protein